ncbi:polyadenylate-binding protein 1 isoform X2 [Oncorhynchus tshawytscha]|uniref:polyadenylate-binding protein 1 isoform X2 n=1 Tax=Oncorhynchus tshawytscha TaxID=74940 RepID=UPI000D09FDBB|nr:polyadenylate-binding protein 1 isoform X2 [Oncorhynchus tshawytscha]XP_042182504.1 polyadenylate-binding protein 1 isoform X2 [Oncorhynchus tshawytscha]
MESAVESSPIVTENKGITLPEVESASIVSESEKPILSAVETVESPSTISENKELTPSAVKDKDVSIVSECKKTTPCAVETNDNEDITIVSESKKPTKAPSAVENASIISESSSHEGHRLWIGNIDPKITEYHLVKLLERFGKVKQFDFLFHKSGPMEGQPRGYCFVNFHTKEEAERAIHCLNGKLALSKKLVVRWAHAQLPHNACGFDQKQHQTNSDTLPAWSMVRLS